MRRRSRPARPVLAAAAAVSAALALGIAALPSAAAPAPAAASPAAVPPAARVDRDLFDHAAKLAGVPEPEWYEDSIPFLDLPSAARQVQDLYYYRWQVTKEQTKYTGTKNRWVDGVFVNGKGKMGPNSYLDLRWMRQRGIVENDVAVHETAAELRYTDPTADNLLKYAQATGNTQVLKDVLADLVVQWNSRADYFDPAVGLYWHQPVWDATEHTIAAKSTDFEVPADVDFANPEDFLRPVDHFFGGYGYSAPLNAAQAADANAIAVIAGLVGDTRTAATYAQKGRALQSRMLSYLWDPNRDFFFHVMKDNAAQGYTDPKTGKAYPQGTKLSGREVFGYYPWQFGLVPDEPEYAGAWKQLLDPQGFGTAFGPSTAEVRNPLTDTSGEYDPGLDNGNCCRWDGPAWPYTHARTLQALANFLDDYTAHTAPGDTRPAATRATYLTSLAKFAALERKDGEPYTAEAADSVTGQWIYDTNGRSNDNNQYPVDDGFITGLVGVRPALGTSLSVKPLADPSWTWWAAENVPYHGHLLKVVYDRDGRHYGVGAGLSVYVDGALRAHRADVGPVTLDVGATVTPTVAPFSTASRYDGSRTNWAAQNGLFPKYSASFTPRNGQNLAWAFDGTTLFKPELPYARVNTTGSPNRSDWFAADFGTARRIDEIRVASYSDAAYPPPSGLSVQMWDGAAWAPIPGAIQTPGTPKANGYTSFRFPAVSTSQIRVVTGDNQRAEAIAEIEAWGPTDTRPVNCPSAGPLHYEAEAGVVNLGNGGIQAPLACGNTVVGGLDTTKNYFVDDFSKVRPGDWSATHTGPLWQGFTGTSWVDFYVDVPSSGTWTGTLRYANGIAGTPAVEAVSVDGGPARTISLPPTGGFSLVPGAIKTASSDVYLTKGRHRIRVAVQSGFAEFDSLDLAPRR